MFVSVVPDVHWMKFMVDQAKNAFETLDEEDALIITKEVLADMSNYLHALERQYHAPASLNLVDGNVRVAVEGGICQAHGPDSF